MKIKVNNKSHEIPAMSKLSFETFNKVIFVNEIFELKEYIAVFADMPIDELMNAEIKTFSMPALHALLFDIDVEKTIKTAPDTFYFDNDTHLLQQMTLSTFGQNYIFDLYYGKYNEYKINFYQLCVYALSCYLTKDYSTSEVQKTYDILKLQDWRIMLPVAFFLARKFLRKKKGFLRLWILYTAELKKIRLLSRYRAKSSRHSVKKLLDRF